MSNSQEADRNPASSQRRWFLIFALTLIMFIINVDYLAVNLALVPIAADLHSNLNVLQWILGGYVLAWAVLVIPAGRYMERYAKKQVCLFGLGLFLIASLLAGAAQSDWLLIVARVLQGAAGAIYAPSVYALIFLNFAENERGRAMGLMSLGVGLGMALGPFVGGLLLALFNWRSIFYINLPIGLISLAIIYFSANAEERTGKNNNISKASTMLLSISLITTIYLLGVWQNWAQNSSYYLGLALVALVSFFLFVRAQKKSSSPLVPLQIFRSLPFTACCVGMLLEQYVFSAIVVATGIYLQKIQQFSSLQSSIIFLALTIVFGVIAVLGGSWVDRVGLKKPLIVGLCTLAAGVLAFALIASLHITWLVCLVLFVIGGGMGLAFLALNTGAVKTAPPEHVSVASSVFLLCALLGNAFGVTMTTFIYEKASITSLFSYLTIDITQAHVQQLIQYIASIGADFYDLSLFDQTSQMLVTKHLLSAMSHGVSQVMLMNAAVCLLATFFCGALLRNKTAVS